MKEENIFLKNEQEYITLQAVLQISDIISTGGMVKAFLMENVVKVNGESENRRGRKLYPNDKIEVLNRLIVIKKQ